jgi:hypothetical protein
MKTCYRCNQQFDRVTGFYVRKASQDGATTYCRACTKTLQASYRATARNDAVAASRAVSVRKVEVLMAAQARAEEIVEALLGSVD